MVAPTPRRLARDGTPSCCCDVFQERAPGAPMNRYEVTKSLVGRLRRGEAVIGGIGNTKFDA